MRKIKEILRLKFVCNLSNRQIAASCNVSRPSVGEYLKCAMSCGMTEWPLIEQMTEEELTARLFSRQHKSAASSTIPLPDYAKVYEELKNKHVTLRLLWEEYRQQYADGYGYTWFTECYRNYKKKLDLVMRQEHKGGEKLFVDYCDGLDILDLTTGELKKSQLFVGVWGASNYTYAEAGFSQDIASWTSSHVRAFEYFQCVPHVVVPDNLKSGVHRACRYEPDINPTYQDLAGHYGFAVIPARPRRPRDKAKVEAGVLVAQRWILAALRHRRFYSLKELNMAIWELLERLNTRPMRKLNKSRLELFQTSDRPHALQMPGQSWEYAEWIVARVNIDYHVEVDEHYYSVPFGLVHEKVDVRITSAAVEVLFKGKRVASHPRSCQKHNHTTLTEHMPTQHQQYREWTPSRIIQWAGKTGPHTAELVQKILESKQHPEQGYRAALGILRLGRTYGQDRVENSCRRAIAYHIYSYRSIRSILANGLDRQEITRQSESGQPLPGADKEQQLPWHDNIRGDTYYKEN